MTELKKKTLIKIAHVAKKSSFWSSQFPCGWWNYQPKKPESVKKLRKFRACVHSEKVI